MRGLCTPTDYDRPLMTPSLGSSTTTGPAVDIPVVVREAVAVRIGLRDILSYRPLVTALATRDLKARYKQSAFGPAWVVFQPIALLVAFSVGFRHVAHVQTDRVPYILFALVGLVVWTYFQAVSGVAVGSIINNYSLVRWTACPRLALPLATLVSNLPSLGITLVAALVISAATGYAQITWLFVPLLCVWLVLLVGVAAVLLSGVAVRARDVASVLPFLLQVLLFLSPVAYATSQLPPTIRAIISLNPLTGLTDAWRWAVLGAPPSIASIAIAAGITLVGVAAAWHVFARLETRMADEI